MPSTDSRLARRRAQLLPLLSLALGLTLGACADEPTRAFAPEPPRDERTATHALGLVEITISGLSVSGHSDGSTQASVIAAPSAFALERMRAHAAPRLGAGSDASAPGSAGRSIAADPDGSVAASPSGPIASSPGTLPVHADASGDGTIQLEPLSVGSFTVGSRGDGGYRYVSATYRVRNAQADSTAYDTPRQNLTFYAVSTSGTLGKTPFSRLARFDGSAAATDPATILPTGAARLDPTTGEVRAAAADVLQVVSEEEAARLLDLAVAGTETVFPYGFVVRNPADPTSRTLPANPAEDEFDGLVTFAFKIPLASSSADDPFTVSAVFMAVDEDDVVVTQSLEEQTPEGQAAFEARATALGASRVTLLPQAIYAGSITPRILCSVRVAGLAGAPESTLTPAPATGAWLLSPSPVVLPRTTQISIAHCGSGGPAPNASNFVVHGGQSGKRFVGQDGLFTRDGGLLTSPVGTFFPGEEIDLTLTTALGSSDPFVTRLRVATAPASATFTLRYEISAPSSKTPETIAIGDLDGDGHLDIVTALQPNSRDVIVFYGLGDGGFAAPTHYPVGEHVGSATIGDVNGDGILDIVTGPPINLHTNSGRVLLGDGARGFSVASSYSLPYSTPQLVALGDVNGDGHLDLIGSHKSVYVALGDGNGGFDTSSLYTYPMHQGDGLGIVLGDVDGDGKLDIVVNFLIDRTLRVLLNN